MAALHKVCLSLQSPVSLSQSKLQHADSLVACKAPARTALLEIQRAVSYITGHPAECGTTRHRTHPAAKRRARLLEVRAPHSQAGRAARLSMAGRSSCPSTPSPASEPDVRTNPSIFFEKEARPSPGIMSGMSLSIASVRQSTQHRINIRQLILRPLQEPEHIPDREAR